MDNDNKPFLIQAGEYIIKFLALTLAVVILASAGMSVVSPESILGKLFTISFLLWIGFVLIYFPISFYKIRNILDVEGLNDFRKTATILCIDGGITIILKSLNYIYDSRILFTATFTSWLIFVLYAIWIVSGILAPIIVKWLKGKAKKKELGNMTNKHTDFCCLCGKRVDRRNKYNTYIGSNGKALCKSCYDDLFKERFSKQYGADKDV